MGKDAGGQAGHNLGHTSFMCCEQHIVVDAEIVSLQENEAINPKKKSHILSSLSCHREHQVKTVDMYFDSYQEVQVLSHVHEKPPDHSSQVNNVRWLVHFKHFSCVLQVPEGRIQEQ